MTQFGYDHRGNLTERSQTIGTTATASLTYAYDLADRITQVGYPSGREVHYNRDAKGRVSGVETRASPVAAWVGLASNMSYQPFGAVESMALGNGLTATNERGLDGRLKRRRLTSVTTGTALADLSYVHDPDGNVASIDDHVSPARSAIYGYDAMGRLNMMVAEGSASNASYVTTTGTNQLASITTPVGTRSIQYDGRGNPTAENRPGSQIVTIAYDGHGRMTSYARTGEADLTHAYNGLDDRVATTTVTGGNSDTRRFVYAPDGRVMGEYGTGASDVKAEFIWISPEVGDAGTFGGDDGLGGYMPLSVAVPTVAEPGRLLWAHGNHMGVPTVFTDATGTEISFPAGYALPGFPGQSRTPGLLVADLYYNRYRDYDPTTGRYIQADPIGLAGGANPYNYAMNSPLRYADPTGEIAIPLIYFGGAALIAGGILVYEAWNHNLVPPGLRAPMCFFGGSHDGSFGSGGRRSSGGARSIPVVLNNKGEGDRCVDGWLYETEVYCTKNFKGDSYFGCLRRAGERLQACKRDGLWPPNGPRRWTIFDE